MASYPEHISQAQKNLTFLKEINNKITDCWDWQVTVVFYIAVHLINAHIAKMANEHYRSHDKIKDSLNPYNVVSVCKLTEENYISYVKMHNLSRRARYLIHDDENDKTTVAKFTYDKHVARAIKNLDNLMAFMNQNYKVEFPKISIKCIELSKTLTYFTFQD